MPHPYICAWQSWGWFMFGFATLLHRFGPLPLVAPSSPEMCKPSRTSKMGSDFGQHQDQSHHVVMKSHVLASLKPHVEIRKILQGAWSVAMRLAGPDGRRAKVT